MGIADLAHRISPLARRDRAIAQEMIRRADMLRDARRFPEAAVLYAESLRFNPRRGDIHVQAGHMLKESGHPDEAEHHYLAGLSLAPDDADLALQLGHFYKSTERMPQALAEYRRALVLRPGWGDPQRELDHIVTGDGRVLSDPAGIDAAAALPERDEAIVRQLLPGPAATAAAGRLDSIDLRRLGGRRERSEWGLLPMLSGVEAIRGVCFSRHPLNRVELAIDGVAIHAEPPIAGPSGSAGVTKYVFNLWVDLSAIPPGLHLVQLVIAGDGEAVVRRQDHVLVAAPLHEADHPGSDGLVEIDAADPRPAEVQIRARPSMIRPPAHGVLPATIRTILVLRTDQLGDVVVSIPALRRLRALFPQARIVGLVTAANIDMARTTSMFDELIAVPFPDDLAQRRRVMTRDDQIALRERLAPYAFDIALDLATSHMSRPLLLLSGAKFLYGFHDAEWSWLSAGIEGGTHDPKNHLEAAPQSGKIRALIERLGTIADSGARVLRRDDLSPDRLAAFGVSAGRYIVLHTGARIAFSRWPHYPALVAALLERTELDIVLMTDDPAWGETLDPELLASPRVRLLDRRLDFDDFDALISFCAGFVGNDSGPKHFASLRGVPVVSIHGARVNWSEWGQELSGAIVSRRVPCAGCALYHDVDECGKGYACVTDITAAEVAGALLAQL